MIKINPYYRTDEDLNKAEEPFMSITRILERLYLDGVNGKKDVSYNFKNTYAVSCMRDFAEDLAKKQTTFVSRLNSLWGSLMHPNNQFSNSFDSYGVPYERYQGIIFGGVYYLLAKQKSVTAEHLDMLSSFVSAKAEALPYFNVYKEAAKANVSAQPQDMTTLRKQFIRRLNSNPDIVGKVDWADVTIAFSRSVMTEIFWGVENDDVLKTVCKNITNTWNKLYEKKDPRCYDEGVAGKGIVPNLDPWKFGGLTKEPIEVFFSRLWVERNAKTAYRSFGGDTDPDSVKPKGEPTVSDEETMAKIREQDEKLQAKSKEFDAVKAENEQLKKDKEQLENSLAHSKDLINEKEQKAANAYEKIIFFATVLSVAYDDRFTNQTSLSNLICMVCGGRPSTYQPRISKLAKMADEGKYTDEVCNAAKNLIEKLKAIPKEDDKGNPVVEKYIESISSEFDVQ